jgi:hypothetical protein
MRTSTRFSLVILLLFLCLFSTACTTAWTSEAESIISLLVPAIEAALGILGAFGLAAGLSSTVMDDVRKWAAQATSDLQTVIKPLIDSYNTAVASAQPGILNEIEAALNVILDNYSKILPAIHVTNPKTQDEIEAVVQAIANEITALIALVPVFQGKITSSEELKRLVEHSGYKHPKQFRQDFNQKAGVFGPQYRI